MEPDKTSGKRRAPSSSVAFKAEASGTDIAASIERGARTRHKSLVVAGEIASRHGRNAKDAREQIPPPIGFESKQGLQSGTYTVMHKSRSLRFSRPC